MNHSSKRTNSFTYVHSALDTVKNAESVLSLFKIAEDITENK